MTLGRAIGNVFLVNKMHWNKQTGPHKAWQFLKYGSILSKQNTVSKGVLGMIDPDFLYAYFKFQPRYTWLKDILVK